MGFKDIVSHNIWNRRLTPQRKPGTWVRLHGIGKVCTKTLCIS